MRGSFERRLLIWWVLASIAAYLVVQLLALPLQPEGLPVEAIKFLISLAVPGLAQWLVLRLCLRGMSWWEWVRATAIGSLLGQVYLALVVIVIVVIALPLFPRLFESMPPLDRLAGLPQIQLIVLLELGLASGMGAALLQWRVLSKYVPLTALGLRWLWVLAGAAGGLVIGAVAWSYDLVPAVAKSLLLKLIFDCAASSLGALVTGLVLARLLSSTALPVSPAETSRRVYKVRRLL